MADQVNLPRNADGQPLYIEGYFADRIWRGEQPKYGYPANHVPAATIASMEVKTGYLVALNLKK